MINVIRNFIVKKNRDKLQFIDKNNIRVRRDEQFWINKIIN